MPKLATASLMASLAALGLGIAALMHTAGWHINANAVSAAGSFTAALVALAIATWGWVERKQERDRADKAQAAMVIVEPVQVGGPVALGAFVQNFGALPVLNVSLAKLDIAGQPDVDPGRSGTVAFIQAYRDDKRGCWLECKPPNDAAAPAVDQTTRLTATVWFEDAKGNRWESIFESLAANRSRQLIEIGSPRRISLRRR
jgi:hypothetical protein